MRVATALREALASGRPAVLVTVSSAFGSTPREAGAVMLVTADCVTGTIGGGRLEFDATERARTMLADGEARAAMDVPLGPEIGQCCGGRVRLSLTRGDAALLDHLEAQEASARETRPHVLIFGAGHTGLALAAALSPLPFHVKLIDSRPDTLERVPASVTPIAAAMPEAEVAKAPSSAAFVVMTHDHSLDFLIASEALVRKDAAYVGMIGSATKRERFRRHLRLIGKETEISRLTLPLGSSRLRDKRPEVIAALTAAEITTCLLLGQQEKLTDRLAGSFGQWHNTGNGRSAVGSPG